MREYCWDSPASLYTFLRYLNPAKLGSGLPIRVSPNSPNFRSAFLRKAPKNLGQRSTDELARHGAREEEYHKNTMPATFLIGLWWAV